MKRLFSLFLVLLLAGTAPNSLAYTKHVVPAGKRTLFVTGPMDGSVVLLASQLEQLSSSSKDDVHIVINSPGGMVIAGLQLIQAMDIARARGVNIVCTVGVMAASMAFQLLPHCSERYAMKNTLLLFHPARVYVNGALTGDEAGLVSESLKKTDKLGLADTAEMIGPPSTEWLLKHHTAETLWRAEDLVAESKNDWLNIVDDIVAPGGIFDLAGNNARARANAIKMELRRVKWVIVN